MSSFPINTGSLGKGKRRHGFTLVELLVVIGIIAVLISILLPSLSKARRQALKIKCSNNLRSTGQAFFNYAAQNKGWLPYGENPAFPAGANWLWDMPLSTRDLLVETGGTRKIFYCPFFPEQDTNELWNFVPDNPTGPRTGFAVFGYVFLTERGAVPHTGVPSNFPPQPLRILAYNCKLAPLNIRRDNTVAASAETEIAADACPTNDSSDIFNAVKFGGIQGGWAQHHQVSHLDSNGRPEGVNVLFMDGHVVWRPSADMRRQTNANGSPFWWF